MDLTQYVAALRHHLVVAADAGGDDARQLAERLTAPLESAARLVMLDVLSAAAAEITRELAPGSVDVRLRGGAAELVVTSPPADEDVGDAGEAAPGPAPHPMPSGGDDDATARITLRIPDQLKGRIEEAAGREGVSVNAWLVRVVADAVAPGRPAGRRNPLGGQRHTGWVR